MSDVALGSTPDESRLSALELFALFDRLVPMHLVVKEDGTIAHIGPTLAKLMPEALSDSRDFFKCFEIRRPRVEPTMQALATAQTASFRLMLRDGHDFALRGDLLPLTSVGLYVISLSFGISIAEAVHIYDLSNADFSVTDLAIELLYLIEANTAVLGLSRRLNFRLEGAMAEAQKEATTDELTGLLNRRALYRLQDFYMTSEQEFGILQVDLDHFKQVNDTYGHHAGDEVLQRVAQILRGATKPEDAIIRMGGDEFVLIVNNLIDPDVLTKIAQRLIRLIEEPIPAAGHTAHISASIGGTLSRWYHDVDLLKMLTDADQALYDVKDKGRGDVMLFHPDSS